MLLRFRTENHRSLRDDAELSLVASNARGAVPADGSWQDFTTRVAGIYGANASGKSNVLNALDFMCRAVMFSATRWGADEAFPYAPFSLDSTSCARPSAYEVDLVVEGVRYTYGFESNKSGIISEWLYSYPARRRRTLFERHGGEEVEMRFGRNLPGENSTMSKLLRPTALFLSVAANNNHPTLTAIFREFRDHFKYARFTEYDKSDRLRLVTELIRDSQINRQAQALLKFADLGIVGIEIDEKEIPSEFRNTLERVLSAIQGEDSAEAPQADIDMTIEAMRNQISFLHSGEGENSGTYQLEMHDQSAGTIAWLSIGVPALISLRNGDVFMVDEIDSSLHPRLTSALIQLFKDPQINTSGAQLIFTSHDTSLLGKMLGNVLDADEVWFTEKQRDGATEVYALQEFYTRKNDNFELRYLQGRYGAIPIVEQDELREALVGQGA